jgi:hypothetical protein
MVMHYDTCLGLCDAQIDLQASALSAQTALQQHAKSNSAVQVFIGQLIFAWDGEMYSISWNPKI